MALIWLLLQDSPTPWVQVYLATLQTGQVVLLAWIGSEQAASGRERRKRQAEEGRDPD